MSQEFDESISKITKEEISGRGITVGYRAVSILAVVAFILSLFTPLMMLSNWFIFFPLTGALCGVFGLYNIVSCPFDYTGRSMALAGIMFSLVLGIAATGWGVYLYYFSIPYGYTLVHYLELRPDESGKLPERIVKLAEERRKIFIKGYVHPMSVRQLSGIENFMLVRSAEHCKFCATQLNPYDMITVHCTGSLRAFYRHNRTANVGGELFINEEFNRFGGTPYHIEADIFR